MSEQDDLDLRSLDDDELVQQMHDDLYDGLKDEVMVAIDLETSGLDSEKDRIIEVGAVRFRGRERLATYSTLVNPNLKLDTTIVALTNISQTDVDSAPQFSTVAPDVESFIGDYPLVGHRVSFDLGFLKSHGVRLRARSYDTFDLASVVVPHGPEYGLAALSARFKAASMGAGLPNLVSMVTTTDIPDYLVAHMGSEFWDDYDTYERHSAIYRIANVTTPTQVIHGQNDDRVPLRQGQEFYVALQRRGIPTEMIVYPRTPHGPREPKFVMDVSERILSWFERHLRRKKGEIATGGE